MSETYQFKLPLVQAAQAQKHVTVNEALARMDALAQLHVQSRSVDVPGVPIDGHSYIVPAGATGAWAGQDHKVALFLNGGWDFVDPGAGWTAWVIDEAAHLRFQGGIWDHARLSQNTALAQTQIQTLEFDHTIQAGSDNTTSAMIPSHSVVFGVSGRVVTAVNGPASIKVGVVGQTDRYGHGYGVAQNSYILGLSGTPLAYYADTPILLTADGGDFVDGVVRLALHLCVMAPPAVV